MASNNPSQPATPASPKRSDRVTLGLIVQLAFKNVAEFVQGYSVNISASGMFVRSHSPQPEGTLVQFEMQLASGVPVLRGAGFVVWSQTPAGPNDKPRVPGMGIRFTQLAPESKQLIRQMVAMGQNKQQPPQQSQPATATRPNPAAAQPASQPAGPQLEDQLFGDLALEPASPSSSNKRPVATKRSRLMAALQASLDLTRMSDKISQAELERLFEDRAGGLSSGNGVDLGLLWSKLMSRQDVNVQQAALPLIVFEMGRETHGVSAHLPPAVRNMAGRGKLEKIARKTLKQAGGFETVFTQFVG